MNLLISLCTLFRVMAGCTAVVALKRGDTLYVANAGTTFTANNIILAIDRWHRMDETSSLYSHHLIHWFCNAHVLVFFPSVVWCYVVLSGDSRAVLCRANGVAYPLSEDHKPNQVQTVEYNTSRYYWHYKTIFYLPLLIFQCDIKHMWVLTQFI